MILKYQKVTRNYSEGHSSTITLVEPDLQDEGVGPTELCTIGLDTYVYWPDGLEISEQPFDLDVTLEEVTLTDELKAEIKSLSPHVQLSYRRLNERIRSRYSLDDEQYFSRISIGALSGTYTMLDDEPGQIAAYQVWVEECREIARLERVALGLG